jgi:hypothetical protein
MSTLKVATLQDLSAANSSTPEQIAQGRAKAWCNFNGTSTPAINDDYFCSSITDHGTGDWSVNFDSALSNANYAITFGTVGRTDSAFCLGLQGTDSINPLNKTTTAVRMMTGTAAGTKYDIANVSVVIFGD